MLKVIKVEGDNPYLVFIYMVFVIERGCGPFVGLSWSGTIVLF